MTHLFRPSARIDIAGQSLSAAEAGLVSADLSLGLSAHALARLRFWQGTRFNGAAPGDPITIALGPEGDEVTVLTGQVSASGPATGAMVIEAEDSGGALSRLRASDVFEDMSIGDIAARLGEAAGLSVEAESGASLPVYYVDPLRSHWDWLCDLARLGGTEISVDAAGGLVLRAPGGGAAHVLRYGAELLEWDLSRRVVPGALAAGAHGDAGSGNWHWIAPDPLGDAPGAARMVGVLSDRDGATTAGDAARGRGDAAAVGGWLVISGDPAIRPGDSVTLEDLPVADPGPLTVRAVRHALDGRTGFLSTLRVVAGAGGAGGGLPGGLS